MDEYDLIDTLIDALNDGVNGVTFDRDVLDTNRPEDWAAVEQGGENGSEWADGKQIDQTLNVDIWVCVSERGSRMRREVQQVLQNFGESYDIGWRFVSRNYLYDLDKVMWRWTVTLWGPIGPEAEELPAEDPEDDTDGDPDEWEDPEWPELDPEGDEG